MEGVIPTLVVLLTILVSHVLLRRDIAGLRRDIAGLRRDIAGLEGAMQRICDQMARVESLSEGLAWARTASRASRSDLEA